MDKSDSQHGLLFAVTKQATSGDVEKWTLYPASSS